MPNWNDVLYEIKGEPQATSLDIVRRRYLKETADHTNRNVIAYYSGFLSRPQLEQTRIIDEDKNGFMMAVHKLDRSKGLDLILHTPGGDIASTQSIVDYLQQMFDYDIRAIVPQIAMSAGTMIACSCKVIVLAKHSNLGPIDPQLAGVPAEGVKQEFQKAYKEIKADPVKMHVWRPILEKYHPTFLSQCEMAIKWSNDFVRDQLANVMFKSDNNARDKAGKIVKKLSGYSTNKRHDKHIHFAECKSMGLNVELLEDDSELQDLVLTVHHCYMHAFMNSSAMKIIENHNGVALVRSESVVTTR